jgi:hypothetical protein
VPLRRPFVLSLPVLIICVGIAGRGSAGAGVAVVASISISSGQSAIAVSGTDQSTATATDENGNVVAGISFAWQSATPGTGVFSLTGGPEVARGDRTAVLLKNGTVRITGGGDANNNALAGAELYEFGP